MDLQNLAIKLFAVETAGFEQAALIPLFHRWIQGNVLDELMPIDVADYTHVHEGPGVMLICHEGQLALDEGEGRLGVLYSNKRLATGRLQDRLRLCLRRALAVASRLEADTTLRFGTGELLIRIDDRLQAPNTAASFQSVSDDLRPVLTALYDGAAVDLEHIENPKTGLTIRATFPGRTDLATLLKRVGATGSPASGS